MLDLQMCAMMLRQARLNGTSLFLKIQGSSDLLTFCLFSYVGDFLLDSKPKVNHHVFTIIWILCFFPTTLKQI